MVLCKTEVCSQCTSSTFAVQQCDSVRERSFYLNANTADSLPLRALVFFSSIHCCLWSKISDPGSLLKAPTEKVNDVRLLHQSWR